VPRDPALNVNWDKISEQSKILCRSLKANIANAFLQEVAKLTQSERFRRYVCAIPIGGYSPTSRRHHLTFVDVETELVSCTPVHYFVQVCL
jgi:predicted DNA-binding WGR domain protein